jgi:hypothetical protein
MSFLMGTRQILTYIALLINYDRKVWVFLCMYEGKRVWQQFDIREILLAVDDVLARKSVDSAAHRLVQLWEESFLRKAERAFRLFGRPVRKLSD